MINLSACPRCHGAILDYGVPLTDSPLCLTCGWRRADVSPEVKAEVEAHRGKTFIGDRFMRQIIGTGKPSPSGWEREKRKKERE
jgi:hypothetical protein